MYPIELLRHCRDLIEPYPLPEISFCFIKIGKGYIIAAM